MQRRDFMKKLGLGLMGMPLIVNNSYAISNKSGQNLLVVFLRGAYDGLNCLVPNSSFYYENRPNIAIKKEILLPVNSDFSLHPVFQDNIYQLFTANELCFIPASGSEDNTRSHFESQDFMEMGEPLKHPNFNSGFLGRLSVFLPVDSSALSFTSNSPLIFKGNRNIPNLSLNNVGKSHINQDEKSAFAQMYGNSKLGEVLNDGMNLEKEVSQNMQDEMANSARGAYSGKGFSKQTGTIAEMMKNSNGMLGFVDVGGWDTHVNQGAETGTLANNLKALGEGLFDFKNALGDSWARTTVIVISEFGRTARENGNRGTDHGHGNTMWVLGGSVRGGNVKGNWDGLGSLTLHENRDVQVLNDYRGIIGGIINKIYDLNPQQLQFVFPQTFQINLNII